MIFNKVIKKTIFFLGFGLIYLNSSAFAANSDYAALPPFISADVKANVLFVMDFSGSMQGPANHGTVWHGYSGDVANYGNWGDNIWVTYNKDKSYYGYYDSEKYYKYNSSGYWEVDENTSFSGRVVGSKDSLSGNFLNFILMTRVDVSYKSLFGGKASCPAGKDYCILEPVGSKREVYISISGKNYAIRVKPSGSYGSTTVISVYEAKHGSWSDVFVRNADVKIAKKDRTGIIQENFDKVRFGFIAYADTNNKTALQGTIKYGLHENSVDGLIQKFEDTIAYSGTHTGEALDEAYDYLRQSGINNYNSTYNGTGTLKDPYYEKRADGVIEAAFCRKSFVVLISDGAYNGNTDPDSSAYNLHKGDLRTDIVKDQIADVYSLFAFADDKKGEQSMKTVAAFGKYKDLKDCSNNIPYDFSVGTNSLDVSFPRPHCKPAGTYNDCCKEWDSNKDGIPDGFYLADDGDAMASALTAIFSEIRQGTSSGTAVTALTSKTTGGSAITQAAFYPEKEFENNKKIVWTGDLIGNWYLNNQFKDADGNYQKIQNIREDTNNNFILNVKEDRIIQYLIENDSLKIKAYQPDEYGTVNAGGTVLDYNSFQDINNLFDSGKQLMETKPEDRKIYGVDENNALAEFTQANSAVFDSVLGTNKTEYPVCLIDGSGNPDYKKLINYTRGKDFTGCRLRATNNSATDENVWKLGDITYSSPTIVNYDTYSMIYIGSNSGMLHAFRMGYVRNRLEIYNPKEIVNDSSPGFIADKIGLEEWAFVPKDAMPYLRYMASPEYDHVYTVDLKPFIVNTGSKIILIGGMRLGGANKNGNVNPPSDTASTGRSAYFALDITDPDNPKYLWRYAPDSLGFSYSGPAYIKRMDPSGKIKHFVMFASGPTEYNGTTKQNLQIFVVDLLTGEEKDIHGDSSSEMNISNSYGGRLFTNGLDLNDDGQTDFVFLGYTDKADGSLKDMGGGVIKIYTGSDDPTKWDYNTSFLTSVNNPITAPVTSEECFSDSIPYPYLYFGTGRYFIANDDTQKTLTDKNYLYAVPFTCDENNNNCATINSIGNASDLTCDKLKNVQTNPAQAAWKIELKGNEGAFLRERCYSDPSPSDKNIVFFTTAMPTIGICQCGGQSRSWSLNCATGRGILYDICENETVFEIDPKIRFQYLLQLSRGNIMEYGNDDFDASNSGATAMGVGVPSESGGLAVMSEEDIMTPEREIHYWKEW
ncbi:MAG: hypothetical protein RBR08_07685 [Desulforegulaceae bacterium]|nr:hypothetical protein [Desulforegulaceae bacterium]